MPNMRLYRLKVLAGLFAGCLLFASAFADNHYNDMTDEQVSQSLTDMPDAQLNQQLTEIENRVGKCESWVDFFSDQIKNVETDPASTTLAEYLKMKKTVAYEKKCAKQHQRLVDLLKSEIFRRLKVTNSDHHNRNAIIQLKNLVLRVQQKINEVNSKSNAALKMLESLKPAGG